MYVWRKILVSLRNHSCHENATMRCLYSCATHVATNSMKHIEMFM